MTARGLAACLLALAGVLAGCSAPDGSGGPDGPDGEPHPTDGLGPAARLHARAPRVQADVEDTLAWWEDVATSYPKHDTATPTNAQLRSRIAQDMADLGFDVEVLEYAASYDDVPLPTGDGLPMHVIVARKQGAGDASHAIGLVSHYDSQALTVMGAYDDLSGVAAERGICAALAQVPMNKTLDCIFFDAEEWGLQASKAYVQDVVVEGDGPVVYDFVLGYDMTGINWPGHPWKMYAMVGENVVPEVHPLMTELLHDVLGYPAEGVAVLDVHDRNSDERRFKEAGVPIVRFAGGRHAADYPMYHRPGDTVQYVDLYVGGRENFAAGMKTILDAGVATVLVLDQTHLEDLRRPA